MARPVDPVHDAPAEVGFELLLHVHLFRLGCIVYLVHPCMASSISRADIEQMRG